MIAITRKIVDYKMGVFRLKEKFSAMRFPKSFKEKTSLDVRLNLFGDDSQTSYYRVPCVGFGLKSKSENFK